MAWKMNDMSGGPGFIGNILTSMGEERGMDYLRKLSGHGSSWSMPARAPFSIR